MATRKSAASEAFIRAMRKLGRKQPKNLYNAEGRIELAQRGGYTTQRRRRALAAGFSLSAVLLAASASAGPIDLVNGLDPAVSTYLWTGQNYADGEYHVGNCQQWFSPFANVGQAACFNSSGNPAGAVWQSQEFEVAEGQHLDGSFEAANLCVFQCAPGLPKLNTSAVIDAWLTISGNSWLLGTITPGVDNSLWHSLSFGVDAWQSGMGHLVFTNRVPEATGDDFALKGIVLTTTQNTPVPEPMSLLLLGAGLIGVAHRVRRS